MSVRSTRRQVAAENGQVGHSTQTDRIVPAKGLFFGAQFYLRPARARLNPPLMLLIDESCRAAFAAIGLTSFESIVACFEGNGGAGPTRVLVKQHTIEPPGEPAMTVFYKRYEHGSGSWKFLARASKARREFENYSVFARLAVACAQRLACGEQRDALGRLRQAFIITRAIPGALPLIEFVAKHCPGRSTSAARTLRSALCRQLADMTRRIHDAGFFHHDLVWRNILVTSQSPGEPALWWIDCPRGRLDRWSPWRQRRRWRDLASLDKSASKYCSRGERVAFIKRYLRKPKLDAEAKRLIRDTLDYRRRRWPEDWNG
jgi:tRNA A-37 threonylcarbamoyl transferase component Bud32